LHTHDAAGACSTYRFATVQLAKTNQKRHTQLVQTFFLVSKHGWQSKFYSYIVSLVKLVEPNMLPELILGVKIFYSRKHTSWLDLSRLIFIIQLAMELFILLTRRELMTINWLLCQ
jgi:hypothetical protein